MKKRKNIKHIIVFLIIIILIICAIILGLKKLLINPANEEKKEFVAQITLDSDELSEIEKKQKEEEIKKLSQMSEKSRMEYYASQFLKKLQAREINSAYNDLNKEFKSTYFKKSKDFDSYVKKYIPKEMSIKYDNIERLGEIYVIKVSIKDVINMREPNDFSMYIVIKEKDYANFELSFSADKPMEKFGDEIEE